MSVFTQSERDYWLLVARRLDPHMREVCALLLTALAEGARASGKTWDPEELEELAKLTLGEPV